MKEHVYIIAAGSNTADAHIRVEEALRAVAIMARGAVRASRSMLTEPVDFPTTSPFVNLVAEVRTPLAPSQVHQRLKAIEAAAGRRPGDKARGRVVVDVDVVAVDGRVTRPADWGRAYVRTLAGELGLEVG